MNPQELVLKFWNSWQHPADWDEMRSCLADEYKFDAGIFQCEHADQAVAIAQMGNPWKEVKLLDLVSSNDQVVIVYQGTDTVSGIQFRVSEFLKVANGKIIGGFGNVAPTPILI